MPFVRTRVEIEGIVSEILVEVPENEVEPWKKDEKLKIVGQRVRRIDGEQRVTGRAVYASDIQLPGMVWCKILRSPYPMAEIVDIDTSEAEKIPGVLAILHHKNTEPMARGIDFVFNPTLRYVGAEVAGICAVNEHVARDAIDAIKVTYKVLPFVIDPVKGAQPDSPKIHERGNNLGFAPPRVLSRGDIAKGEAEAEAVVDEFFHIPGAHHCSMEAHSCVAYWENDDQLVVHDSTQSVTNIQTGLAAAFALPRSKVKVSREFTGGGFGSKTGVEKYHLITVMLARKVKRPVKVYLERWEEIITTGHRPETIHHLRMGCKKDGTLTFINLKAYTSAGAYGGTFARNSGIPAREMYGCVNVKTEDIAIMTNVTTNSAMRGPGNTEGMISLEAGMDRLAEKIGMDAIAFRKKNDTPYGDQVLKVPYSSKGLAASYDIGVKQIGWATKRNKTPGAGQTGPIKRGVGAGSLIWAAGGGPPSAANVVVSQDGSVTLQSAFNDIGEGALTAMAMVCAEELGVPMSRISVKSGDTTLGAFDQGTFGSRLTPSLVPAIRNAAADARRQVLEAASQILNLEFADLYLEDAVIKSRKDPAVKPTLASVAARFTHWVVGTGFRGPNPRDYRVTAFGSQFAEVEVDTRTGKVKVLKIVAAHDCGRAINPFLVESQIIGGLAFGRGYAMSEGRIVDRNTGVIVTNNYVEYKLPTALDSPELVPVVVDQVDEFSNNANVKGMAEPPCIPTAPAILNAIYNATGVMVRHFPLTPDNVLKALMEAGKS